MSSAILVELMKVEQLINVVKSKIANQTKEIKVTNQTITEMKKVTYNLQDEYNKLEKLLDSQESEFTQLFNDDSCHSKSKPKSVDLKSKHSLAIDNFEPEPRRRSKSVDRKSVESHASTLFDPTKTPLVKYSDIKRLESQLVTHVKMTKIGCIIYGRCGLLFLPKMSNNSNDPLLPDTDLLDDIVFVDVYYNSTDMLVCTSSEVIIQPCSFKYSTKIPLSTIYNNGGYRFVTITCACMTGYRLYLGLSDGSVGSLDIMNSNKFDEFIFKSERNKPIVDMFSVSNTGLFIATENMIVKVVGSTKTTCQLPHVVKLIRKFSDEILLATGTFSVYAIQIKNMQIVSDYDFGPNIVDITKCGSVIYVALEKKLVSISVKDSKFEVQSMSVVCTTKKLIRSIDYYQDNLYLTTDYKVFISNSF